MAALIDEQSLSNIEVALRRIFAMKITRSTFRELQNIIITAAGGNKDTANDLFEALVTGQKKEKVFGKKFGDKVDSIVHEFSIPIRLAKEIHERGEFVSIITSDTLGQQDRVAFLNRIRRIDGDEFLFITDPESTLHLLQHFVGRVVELSKTDKGKEVLKPLAQSVEALKQQVGQINV